MLSNITIILNTIILILSHAIKILSNARYLAVIFTTLYP